MTDEYAYKACVRGYHVYRSIWTPFVGELLDCARDTGNRHDPYAVKVVNTSRETVGHLPKKISSTCSLFLRKGGTICCKVTGTREYSRDLVQGGVEIPCVVVFKGDKCLLEKVSKLLLYSGQKCPPVNSAAAGSSNQVDNCEQNPSKKPRLVSNAKVIDIDECNQDHKKDESSTSDQWLCSAHSSIKLSKSDKLIIIEGQKLNDKHINYAQDLLKSMFPDVEGLRCVLIQERFKFDHRKPCVQILHTRGDHWVVVSNLQCQEGTVVIYDTVFCDVDEKTRSLVNGIFDHKVDINVNHMHKQKGSTDCGMFSIAIATSLLCKMDPISFQQSSLRSHLICCFENNHFVPFP